MAKVIILCGRIASGKSYYAAKLGEKGAVLMSTDDLMLSLFDGCLGDRHDQTVLDIERYFCSLAPQIVSHGADVVLDYGHWSRSLRDEVRDLCEKAGVDCELHYITAPDDIRKKRLELRNVGNAQRQGRQYIIDGEMLARLDAKFEEPDEEEVDLLIDNG